MAEELSMKSMVTLAIIFGVVFAGATLLLLNLFKPGTATGRAGSTGEIGATVSTDLGIEVVAGMDIMNFGTMARGSSKDSTTGTIYPFLIRNMGNARADVEICANQNLWSGASRVPTDYRFSVANADTRTLPVPMDNCVSLGCFDATNSQTAPANMPTVCTAPVKAVNNLNWEDTKDEALVHGYVRVPTDEPAGAKTSTVTVTGLADTTYAP